MHGLSLSDQFVIFCTGENRPVNLVIPTMEAFPVELPVLPVTGAILVLLALLVGKVCLYTKPAPKPVPKPGQIPASSTESLDPPEITPMPADFDWKQCQPYKFRPFRNKEYKMNLAIRKEDPNDWICIENTYLDRTNLRKKKFEQYPGVCWGYHESAVPALREAYDMIFSFLRKRYPMYFYEKDGQIYNSIRDEMIPSDSSQLDGEQLLEIISHNIEEDMLIMLRNNDSDDLDEYVLRAAVACFPAGFNPATKLNQPLTRVHTPVPGYKQKLQFSMNKFFARLKANEFIVRNNWGFQVHTNLCAPFGGSHSTSEEAKEIPQLDPEELDFNKVFMRVEKQSFTRMPQSHGILMITRTYVTAASRLRDDVDVETLCGAIDGVKGDIATYKRKVHWGEAIKAYLRRETNGMTDEVYDYKFTD